MQEYRKCWPGIADLHKIRLIHISTDYVYDGTLSLPHTENEIPAPASVYAQSKLEGEKSLWDHPMAIIIRTSWLYGEFGKNFLKTMLHLGKERKELGMVFDQTGTPTYSGDLANAVPGNYFIFGKKGIHSRNLQLFK